MIQVTLAIAILLIYTLALCKIGGRIPPSLSDSVFYLEKKQRWIWAVTLFVVCFLAVSCVIDKASENTKFLAFISIAALCFVGAAPLVKDSSDLAFKVHSVAAVVCGVSSQLLLLFNFYWLLLLWVPWGIALLYFKCRKEQWRTEVFWAEMVCFANTFAFCYIG